MNINVVFIKVYHNYIIQGKGDSSKIFWSTARVQTDRRADQSTDGIDDITNHVIWYLGTFSFRCCSQAVEALVP